jgi:hypothetical protein
LLIRKLQAVGATLGAFCCIGVAPGGSFEGERLSGEVLDDGSDWQTIRNDGAATSAISKMMKRLRRSPWR